MVEKKTLTIALLSLLAGGTIGFLGANSLNRKEFERLKGENANAQKPVEGDSTGPKLTSEEIRAGIQKADDNPTDLVYQRNMGIALYRYASANKDAELLRESARLLKRVHSADARNPEINIALGNAYFDVGYFEKHSASFAQARSFYEAALAAKPDDAGVRTDYGLTYFLQEPADHPKALAEFEKALRTDPKNEKALEFSTQIHAKRGDFAKARATLDGLKSANAANPAISGLSTLIGAMPESQQ